MEPSAHWQLTRKRGPPFVEQPPAWSLPPDRAHGRHVSITTSSIAEFGANLSTEQKNFGGGGGASPICF